MNPEFKESVLQFRDECGFQSPVVSFSEELKNTAEVAEVIEHLEGLVTILECHPIHANISLKSDILDFRMYLAYEMILRQIGHSRSLVANANAKNHVGTAVAVRCIVELYAFAVYLLETNSLTDSKFMDNLLHGSLFTSGDFQIYERIWNQENGEALPDSFKKLMRKYFSHPHVGTYLKHVKEKDGGFDEIYALYSSYVHPTFGQPRDQYLQDMGAKTDSMDALEDNEYYYSMQRNTSPLPSIYRDIHAGDFSLQMFWSKVMEIDPFFSDELGISPYRNLAQLA